MNANELADLLEVDSWYKLVTREEIATMLRQQQVLIENLNGRIERMIEKQSHYEAMAHAGGFEAGRELGMKQERESNNEPVAWIDPKELDMAVSTSVTKNKQFDGDIPLYTHPVKEQEIKEAKYGITTKWDGITTYHETTEPIGKVKELTDEEINEIFSKTWLDFQDYKEFARAILRKAQEK